MCGIVGYLGKNIEAQNIINILQKLEYRGYDSAGIVGFSKTTQKVIKEVGNIKKLLNKTPKHWEASNFLLHTRWATNGKPSILNAHPHSSFNNKWYVVHNGIIENDSDLVKSLKHIPKSETDTAVIAEILEERNVKNIEDFMSVFQNILGSYAILAVNSEKINEMFLAKKRSPLYICKNRENDFLIASDPICFVGFAKKYWSLLDDEFAYIDNGKIIFYYKNKKIHKKQENMMQSLENNDKSNFSHYMLKEIYEQPTALKKQIEFYIQNDVLGKFDGNFLKQFNNIKLIGCGSAYHACLIGAKYFQQILNIPATAEIASEFIYSRPIFAKEKDLYIFVSQSGETADTISALELAKKYGATCVALTNVLYSTITHFADYVLPIYAGPEIAVASTKAYLCQISALYMFVQNMKDEKNKQFYNELENIANTLLTFNFQYIDKIAQSLKNKKDAVFIGKDLDFITACEGALKLKEITYINATANPAGELKHGYLAIVEKDTPLIVVATNSTLNGKTLNASNEAISRGAKQVVITNECGDCLNDIVIKCNNPLLAPMLSIVPLQYLAYKVSVLKGNNPDQPRNLAKSVTVE